jgi:hypothetical protein
MFIPISIRSAMTVLFAESKSSGVIIVVDLEILKSLLKRNSDTIVSNGISSLGPVAEILNEK